jgi:hypothetical protein
VQQLSGAIELANETQNWIDTVQAALDKNSDIC